MHYKSKTLATWLALLGGSLGLHRLYLRGSRDALAWLHPLPTLAGLLGAWRVLEFGQDDRLSWLLLPLLGLMLAQAALCAIVYGLTPDARWDARHNPGAPVHATAWGPVLGVIAALMIGATALMATIAFSGQRYFEWQVEASRALSQ
ncbi:MAG: NINE protein [Burkholderiaceae bacterium]|nr:NINE protein [Burkholderiaceae bacterium]